MTSTHCFNRIPTNSKWFVYDAYYLCRKGKKLTPSFIKQIYDTGHTHIYISIGYKYAKEQDEYQTTLKEEMNVLKDIMFNVVIIDSLNPCMSSIRDILKSELYIMGRSSLQDNKGSISGFDKTWNEGEYVRPNDSIKAKTNYEEYRDFNECNFPIVMKYYENQLTEKISDKTLRKRRYGKYM
jgi:hypothetical protein